MKQLIQNSSFAKISRGLTMGLASCAFLGQLAYAQKPTVVSATTDKGITTTTYSDGKVVKSLAEGYQFDTLFYKPGNAVQQATQKYLKVSGTLGIAKPFGSDLPLYSTSGPFATVGVGYFWSKWGLSALVGAESMGINSDAYTDYVNTLGANMGFKNLQAHNFSRAKDFMFLAGPSYAGNINEKFEFELGAKVGFIFTYAPKYGATDPSGFSYSISPSSKKLDWGVGLNGSVSYILNKYWSLGLNLQGSYFVTPYQQQLHANILPKLVEYNTYYYNNIFMLSLGATASYKLPISGPVLSQLAPPPAPPVVTPPVLNQGAKMFDYGSKEIPTFSWKSTSPSAKNEEFIFKLYKADGSGVPVYQQTTKSNSISLPKSVSLVNGDDASFYYYTVQSSIGKYLSEPTSSSFGYKAKPYVPEQKTAQDQYIVKIFNGKAAAVATTVKRKPVRKSTSTAVTGSGSKPLVPRKSKKTGNKPAVAKAPVVNYENVSTDPSIKWPSDLPLPQKPSVYEYEVQRLSAGDCKPTGQVAKYKFYIDPKKPNDIRIIPDSPKK